MVSENKKINASILTEAASLNQGISVCVSGFLDKKVYLIVLM